MEKVQYAFFVILSYSFEDDFLLFWVVYIVFHFAFFIRFLSLYRGLKLSIYSSSLSASIDSIESLSSFISGFLLSFSISYIKLDLYMYFVIRNLTNASCSSGSFMLQISSIPVKHFQCLGNVI